MDLYRPSSRDRAVLPPFGVHALNSVSPQSLMGTLEVLYKAEREAAGEMHRRTVDQQQKQRKQIQFPKRRVSLVCFLIPGRWMKSENPISLKDKTRIFQRSRDTQFSKCVLHNWCSVTNVYLFTHRIKSIVLYFQNCKYVNQLKQNSVIL
jgi:hypothetical protein